MKTLSVLILALVVMIGLFAVPAVAQKNYNPGSNFLYYQYALADSVVYTKNTVDTLPAHAGIGGYSTSTGVRIGGASYLQAILRVKDSAAVDIYIDEYNPFLNTWTNIVTDSLVVTDRGEKVIPLRAYNLTDEFASMGNNFRAKLSWRNTDQNAPVTKRYWFLLLYRN